MYPSIKTLITRLGVTREQAKVIRVAMVANTALDVTNKILDAYGVESIGLPDGSFANCQTPDVDIRYVNRGDTYATTLMLVNGKYRVGAWGDVVEQYDSRHGRREQ